MHVWFWQTLLLLSTPPYTLTPSVLLYLRVMFNGLSTPPYTLAPCMIEIVMTTRNLVPIFPPRIFTQTGPVGQLYECRHSLPTPLNLFIYLWLQPHLPPTRAHTHKYLSKHIHIHRYIHIDIHQHIHIHTNTYT
jgi:hypothetical protein